MTLKCVCGTTNRVPRQLTQRLRCGNCKHIFTPRELARAQPEALPANRPFELERETDMELADWDPEDDD